MLKVIELIGEKTLQKLQSFWAGILFIATLCIHLVNPKSYNSATFMVLVKQIYFTAIGILPLFLFMAFLFGGIIIGVVISLATQYNLQNSIGTILITFVVDEFAPFFTALLISLRSSTAVNTEIAVMKVNHELDTLKHFHIDLIDYLFIPRIISGIISVVSLSVLFALIMLGSGYLFAYFLMGIDFITYKITLLQAITIKDVTILFTKAIAFGFVTMAIPIYSGLNAFKSYTAIPIAVLQGMVRLFVALFFIEVVSLIIQYI